MVLEFGLLGLGFAVQGFTTSGSRFRHCAESTTKRVCRPFVDPKRRPNGVTCKLVCECDLVVWHFLYARNFCRQVR